MSEETLRISEIFVSLLGEGRLAGTPALLVRTAGCPLRCRYCDTAYAQQEREGEQVPLSRVVERVQRERGVEHVLVTGGEPLVQPAVPPLLSQLCDAGKTVLLETSGVLAIDAVDRRVLIDLDIKCPDSGEADRTRWENVVLLKPTDEVKLVVASRGDYDYARRVVEQRRLAERCTVWLSPAWGALAPATLARWILDDRLPVRLQLQQHKLIWGAERRGV